MHINAILARLQEHQVQIAWSKMEIAKTEIEYLGIEYSAQGMRPATHIMDKLNSLLDVDNSNERNWRSIQGLLNQYQKYGTRFSTLVEEFRLTSRQRKRDILTMMSNWRVKQGNTCCDPAVRCSTPRFETKEQCVPQNEKITKLTPITIYNPLHCGGGPIK